jgi:hypothetical protein
MLMARVSLSCATMNPINPGNELNRSWKNLTEEFRNASMMRRQGDLAGSTRILNETLPPMIAAWSRLSSSTEATKREQLNQMFERERERIEDAWLTQQILLRQMRDVLIPSLCLQVAEEVRDVLELQVCEITRQLSNANKVAEKPAEAIPRAVTPITREEEPPRIVSLSAPTVGLSSKRPSFDDLPAIIDELISVDWEVSRGENRVAALV